jgi:hypothetical protein
MNWKGSERNQWRNLAGGTDKKQKTSVRVGGGLAKIQTKQLPDTSPEHYYCNS